MTDNYEMRNVKHADIPGAISLDIHGHVSVHEIANFRGGLR